MEPSKIKYESVYKGDGRVFFGPREEGHLIEMCFPIKTWPADFDNYMGRVAVTNPGVKITINWIDAPLSNEMRGEIKGKFYLYDGNLYK